METEVAGALGDATALMASTGRLAAMTVFMVLDVRGVVACEVGATV